MRQTCIAQIAKPAVMSSSLYYSAKQRYKKIQLAAVGKRGESGAMALRDTTCTPIFPFLLEETRATTSTNLGPLFFFPRPQQQSSKATNDGQALHSLRVAASPKLAACVTIPSTSAHSTDFTLLRHNLENSREKKKVREEKKKKENKRSGRSTFS